MRKWLGLAALIVVIDQLTKFVIVQNFVLHESLVRHAVFQPGAGTQPGAAFSLLADAGGWQRWFFIAIAVVASVWVV